MTPHEKAIEAAAKEVQSVSFPGNARRDAKRIISAYLARSRESGWELKPHELNGDAFNASDRAHWVEMFDAAPRFEDAP